MLEMVTYLKDRYMSQKAQGMVEYALIIAFVVALAIALTNSSGLSTAIENVFGSAASKLNGTSSNG